MGYRSRLGKIAKSNKNNYIGKTCEEVSEFCEEAEKTSKESYGVAYPPGHFQLYELGKYVDYSKGVKPFYDFDIHKEWESEFHIMSKEGLLEIIRDYHKLIYQNYKEMEDGKDVTEFIRSRVREWGRNGFDVQPYWLDQEKTDGVIVRSWQYEYAIFNLVYIYRIFDWEKDYLIYSAW